MADSTLDPEFTATPDRILGKGHGNQALGPSDLSDSGSDMGEMGEEADTDSNGTGERVSVGRTSRRDELEEQGYVPQVTTDEDGPVDAADDDGDAESA